eukprot:scaffold204593_cov56-Attheya_sp.AAC.1
MPNSLVQTIKRRLGYCESEFSEASDMLWDGKGQFQWSLDKLIFFVHNGPVCQYGSQVGWIR